MKLRNSSVHDFPYRFINETVRAFYIQYIYVGVESLMQHPNRTMTKAVRAKFFTCATVFPEKFFEQLHEKPDNLSDRNFHDSALYTTLVFYNKFYRYGGA